MQPEGQSLLEQWTEAAQVALHMHETRPSATSAVVRATLFRSFMESWSDAQLRRAPITSAEVEAATAKAWLEVRRPRSVRFGEIFLAVRPIESDELARHNMEDLRARVEGAESTVQFGQMATEAASALGIEISARMWPPVAADGRVVPAALGDDPNESVPGVLVRAATALREPGDKSPVIGSRDGYHLLIAHEIIPEREVPADKIEKVTRPLVAADRGGAELARLREALRKRTPVVIADHRDSLFQLVWRKR